jgi:hypothetical protein
MEHDWKPTSPLYELVDGSLVEGWGECSRCRTVAYVTRQDGEILGFNVGGSDSGFPVDPDCSEVLTRAVMTA